MTALRALLFGRYFLRRDEDRFETERRYQLYAVFSHLLCPWYLQKWGENREAADEFMEAVLSLIRRDAPDDRPDMWTQERLELGLASAARMVVTDRADEAILQVESVVKLLEETMTITSETLCPPPAVFLTGWNGTPKRIGTRLTTTPTVRKNV